MSALDQAFIKAYAKEPALPAVQDTAASAATEAPRAATAERSSRAPKGHAPAAQIENIYASGTLYRIETPRAAQPAPVPAPHFASRRLPLRYRLAQIEAEEIPAPAPVVRRQPPAVLSAPAVSAAKPIPQAQTKAKVPPPPLPVPSPADEIQAVIEESGSPFKAAPILPLVSSVHVRQRWEELLGQSPVVAEGALVVWPKQEELQAAQASSLIALDLETIPEPQADVAEVIHEPVIAKAIETGAPAASPAKKYRIDAAHAPVPEPHKAETVAKDTAPQPTVEDLIQPVDRPPAISAEEAAELVGKSLEAPKTDVAAPIAAAAKPVHFTPAWEVDRFLWPALCDKLLRDEHSYFVQAGGKIAAAVKDGLKSLAITGSRRGEGRTTLALCLARSAAKAGVRVALVDADFARPQLAASLGLEIAASWHDAASGKTTLAEASIKSLEDNLSVLPLDVSTAAAPLSLADPRLTRTLREAAGSFDLLVLDMGPIAAGDDSIFPASESPPADAAIVVRDLRYSTPAESQAIGERLSLSGIDAVGIAENFVPPEKLVA
jgi:Mrp family chromosome partitioning ATPase